MYILLCPSPNQPKTEKANTTENICKVTKVFVLFRTEGAAAPAASKQKNQRQLKSFLERIEGGYGGQRMVYYRLYAETWMRKERERLAIWVMRIVAAGQNLGSLSRKL